MKDITRNDIERVLSEVALKNDAALREFRLTGDIVYLYGCIEETIRALLSNDSSWTDFSESVTSNEQKAFGAIFEAINGDEGNISVVKMLQKTGLSRPVFDSLLKKMDKYGIAIVKNQGVKGTYIKLIKTK